MAIGDQLVHVLERVGWGAIAPIARVTPLTETGDAATSEVRLIVKHGPRAAVEPVAALYERLRSALGDVASSVLPATAYVALSPDEAILCVEPVPGETLEASILRMGDLAVLVGKDHMEVRARQAYVHWALEQVCGHLAILREHRAGDDVESRPVLWAFVGELAVAFRENLRRAGIAAPPIEVVQRPELWMDGWATLIHRDCSVVNIIGSEEAVKLIDPRPVVSGATVGAAFGSPVFDLVALAVSLERKELELERKVPDMRIDARELVVESLEGIVRCGGASRALVHLCEAVVVSAYAACRCTYCLAPDRAWLLWMMEERTRAAVDRCVRGDGGGTLS